MFLNNSNRVIKLLTDGNKASISIANGKILEGKLNKRQKDYIKAWMLIHKEELKKFSIIDGTIEWECGAELSNDTFYIAGEESLLKGCDINGYKCNR